MGGASRCKIGNAFARFLSAKKGVIGQDMRVHSPALADAVSEGVRDAGCDVIRLGLSSTPMTYFSIGSLPCDGGLCVTASHNPGEYNGMKLCREGARPISMATGIDVIQRMCAEEYPAPVAERGGEEHVAAPCPGRRAKGAIVAGGVSLSRGGGKG